MPWPQFWTIVLTGLFVVLGSGVGQYVGGVMANKRADADRNRADRERFTEVKRELFQRAIEIVTVGGPTVGPDGARRLGLEVQQMIMTLGLFDARVAGAFGSAHATRYDLMLALERGDDDKILEFGPKLVADLAAMRTAMARSLGLPEPEEPTLGSISLDGGGGASPTTRPPLR